MFNLVLIPCIFLIGLIASPIYAVIIATFVLLLNSPTKIEFKRIDFFIVVYIAVVGFFYTQLDEIPAIKETFIFVVGPFLFYFLGKSLSKSDIDKKKLYLFITYILTLFSLYIFFRDVNGYFSFSLDQNYYYNSRNNLIIKQNLDAAFMNETNLSLLVLTCIFLTHFLIEEKFLKMASSVVLTGVLLILASRTAVTVLVVAILIHFIKFENVIRKFLIVLFGAVTFQILIPIELIEIPYINTFFKRTLAKSFGDSESAFGLETRFVHYLNAYQNSQTLFDIKGYKELLYTYEFSSHNEVLGHTSSTGILPSIFYFTFIIVLIKDRLKLLERANNLLFYKILLVMAINYFIIGLAENIFICNVMWIYFFFLTIGITTKTKIHYA